MPRGPCDIDGEHLLVLMSTRAAVPTVTGREKVEDAGQATRIGLASSQKANKNANVRYMRAIATQCVLEGDMTSIYLFFNGLMAKCASLCS